MITSLRHTAWMLCGLLLAGAGSGCNSGDGEKRSQPGIGPAATLQLDAPTDMASSAEMGTDMGSSCKAAEGLAADNRLLCVDFTGDGAPQVPGWTFPANCGTDTFKWTLNDGTLSVSSFETFGSGTMDVACSFISPGLSAADLQGYKELTVSIVQRVDLKSGVGTEAAQRAQILLSARTEPLAQFTGNNGPSFRRSMVTVPRAELPTSGMVQATFNLVTTGSAGAGPTGWQIQSIAVLGHK